MHKSAFELSKIFDNVKKVKKYCTFIPLSLNQSIGSDLILFVKSTTPVWGNTMIYTGMNVDAWFRQKSDSKFTGIEPMTLSLSGEISLLIFKKTKTIQNIQPAL